MFTVAKIGPPASATVAAAGPGDARQGLSVVMVSRLRRSSSASRGARPSPSPSSFRPRMSDVRALRRVEPEALSGRNEEEEEEIQ